MPAQPTLVFVPSNYGKDRYGTVYYGGQWYTLIPPIVPPPPPPPPPPGQPPPFQGPWPPLPPPATSSTPGLLGPIVPQGYSVAPFAAEAVDYGTLLLTWQPPTGPFLDFRLVRNRYGFPIDNNDGTVLLDGPNYPGSSFYDNSVIPGTMHYYGIYILVQVGTAQVWYRAGLTAVLAVTNFRSQTTMLLDRLPEFFKIGNLINPLELTTDALGNAYVAQFMGVFGWGLDYLKTQLNIVANLNNAATVPVNMLVNLAATVGFPYYPEVQAATMREAILNQAALVHQRGTLEGIEAVITQLTGWGTDIRPGNNMLLEDDQSSFTDPAYPAWNAGVSYNAGEIVSNGPQFLYSSIASGNLGNTPPTTNTSNSFWNVVYYASNSSVLANATTGWLNTWEPLIDGMANQHPTSATALTERVGILNPLTTIYTQNGLGITNNSGSTSAIELRSVSRSTADITAALQYPSRGQVIGDGIPVPFTLPSQQWYSWIAYESGQVVTYQGLPFLALKASTGVAPPSNGVPTNEWQPIGYDMRIALMLSGYTGQNLSVGGTLTYAVTPYVLWFDETGAFISSVYIRTPASGNTPANIAFASFALPSAWGTSITGQAPDIGTYTWAAQASNFTNNALANGTAVPASVNTRTLQTVTYGSANAQVGVTLVTLPNGGWYGGLVLRWASNTSYLRVDQTTITQISAGVPSALATHSVPFLAGDRMTATCNGNVITVFRNGTQVSTVTTAFNNTATVFGMVIDSSAALPNGTPPPASLAAVLRGRPRPPRRGYWQSGAPVRQHGLQLVAPKRKRVKK